MYKMMNGSVAGPPGRSRTSARAGRVDAAWPKVKDASYHPNFFELALMEGRSNKDLVREENVGNQVLVGMACDLIEFIATVPPR
jgi:hypothetical protein